MPPLKISMVLQNVKGDFITPRFAERLALLVLEEKYPTDVFAASGSGSVVDKGDTWWVTFNNALLESPPRLIPRHLTVQIRKTNGEIVAIS
jgi:hypothetical protein